MNDIDKDGNIENKENVKRVVDALFQERGNRKFDKSYYPVCL